MQVRSRFILFSYFLLVFANCTMLAQVGYFQQEVNYKISVQLNDVKHELSAFEELKYTNNSPVELPYLYFHLWPNAYKNNETDLAKQLLEGGDTKMYFADDKDLGYIDSLDFKVNGSVIKWEIDPKHIDIC